jgi:hypothetical protein
VEKNISGKNSEHLQKPFVSSLRDVVEKGFLPTMMLIREEYDPYFVPNDFNELLGSLGWLRDKDNLALFEKYKLTGGETGLPKPLVNYRGTVELFFELEHLVKSGKYDKFIEVPVAFPVENRELLRRDLEQITYEPWLKFKDNHDTRGMDALCVKLFRAYFMKLEQRALLGLLKKTREPKGV